MIMQSSHFVRFLVLFEVASFVWQSFYASESQTYILVVVFVYYCFNNYIVDAP